MLIANNKIASFMKSPPLDIRVILIFGPDEGLVKERFDQLSKTVVENLRDPFLVSELEGDQLKSDPAKLSDEAAAISMMGGRRVIRIRNLADSHAALFKDFIIAPPGDSLILLAGGDLSKTSKLRQAFEKAKTGAAAIPCYADDTRTLDSVIRDHMREENIQITSDAVAYLSEHLGSSRGTTRSELEKLVLYAGPDAKLSLTDIMDAIGDNATFTMDMVINGAMEGDSNQVDITLNKLWEDNLSPVALIRTTTNHILKIQKVQAAQEEGRRLDEAISSLRPPIFWKVKDRFSKQCRIWTKKTIAQVLTILLNAEADCKKTGLPPEIIAGRSLQQIAALSRHLQRK